LKCNVCFSARIDQLAIERRVTIPAEVLRVIHRDLSRATDSPGAAGACRGQTPDGIRHHVACECQHVDPRIKLADADDTAGGIECPGELCFPGAMADADIIDVAWYILLAEGDLHS